MVLAVQDEGASGQKPIVDVTRVPPRRGQGRSKEGTLFVKNLFFENYPGTAFMRPRSCRCGLSEEGGCIIADREERGAGVLGPWALGLRSQYEGLSSQLLYESEEVSR